ncbi:hypothetical protein HHX47_DHR1002049 [Lentinula edodes]|nr:hypothetical protein HHX47_DHR1002049 [Lentinula edodes]
MDSFPSNNSNPLELPSSSNGRVSGKSWKTARSATVRSRLPDGVKTKSWAARMEQTKRSLAIKKVEKELKDEKVAEVTRWALVKPQEYGEKPAGRRKSTANLCSKLHSVTHVPLGYYIVK